MRPLALLLALSTFAAHAQTFATATIRPSDPASTAEDAMLGGPHRWTARNTTVFSMIVYAFDLHHAQLIDAPAWTLDRRFDIDAVPDTDLQPNREQFHAMLRALLTDRFGLQLTPATRTLPAYAIRLDKNGPRLTPSTAPDSTPPGWQPRGPGDVLATDEPMSGLVRILGWQATDRPLVDQTGLTGRYSWHLRWRPDALAPDAASDLPDLFTATHEQLGLRLEPVNAPVPVFVLTRVTPPTPN